MSNQVSTSPPAPDPGPGYYLLIVNPDGTSIDGPKRETDEAAQVTGGWSTVLSAGTPFDLGTIYRRRIEPVTLRKGGYYRDLEGKVYGPMENHGEVWYSNGRYFTALGKHVYSNDLDLIAECWPEGVKEVTKPVVEYDWKNIPKRYSWMATDANGNEWGYASEPNAEELWKWWIGEQQKCISTGNAPCPHWRETLQQRPVEERTGEVAGDGWGQYPVPPELWVDVRFQRGCGEYEAYPRDLALHKHKAEYVRKYILESSPGHVQPVAGRNLAQQIHEIASLVVSNCRSEEPTAAERCILNICHRILQPDEAEAHEPEGFQKISEELDRIRERCSEPASKPREEVTDETILRWKEALHRGSNLTITDRLCDELILIRSQLAALSRQLTEEKAKLKAEREESRKWFMEAINNLNKKENP